MAVILMICTLVLETAGLPLFIYRMARLERRIRALSVNCVERLGTLDQVIADMSDDGDGLAETRADDRKKAREAERRFTEGVANILNFSCSTGGRNSE